MDTLRGKFADHGDPADELDAYEAVEDDEGSESPPAPVDGAERRMQVRAYNHWASLLDDRNFPAIEDLEPDNLPAFGPYSVLLDFSSGIDNPGIAYLGAELAKECGALGSEITSLADVPPRSLLSRITDHYMQILANQAPIGFEAEFVNQRGMTILYRGILLPFSSDDDTIDFIYGVINWKEMADQQTADALLLEIDQALDGDDEGDDEDDEPAPLLARKDDGPLTDWADGPAADHGAPDVPADDDVLDLSEMAEEVPEAIDDDEPEEERSGLPRPRFGSLLDLTYGSGGGETGERAMPAPAQVDAEGYERFEAEEYVSVAQDEYEAAPHDEYDEAPAEDDDLAGDYRDDDDAFEPSAAELPADPQEMLLGDWLASARELADAARRGEERTRGALYAAIGRAYDFSLAASNDPEGFAELLADAGLTAQERAPMTPVVKLVFGGDYDKTRLTEYAAVLSHAHRLGLDQGEVADFLHRAEGGLKGVVQAERRLRREESGKPARTADAPRPALARKLRKVTPQSFDAISPEGPEFALVMLRRLDDGSVTVVGEVPEDVPLVERAARKLLG